MGKSLQKKTFIGSWVLLFLVVALFLYTLWIAPFAPFYGYYVGASRLMAQGLVPWADFNISDTPLALFLMSLAYRVVGIQQGSNLAIVLLMAVHLLNLFLLYKLLGKYGVKGSYRNFTLIHSVLLLFPQRQFLVRLEPFAVFFLLLSLLQMKDARRKNLIYAALFFTLAVLCKFQVLIMLVPAILLIHYFSAESGEKGKNCGHFISFLAVFLLIAYLLLALLSGEWLFIRHLDHYIQASYSTYWAHFKALSVILICKCGIAILFPGILLYKLLDRKSLIQSCIAVVAFDFQWLLMLMNTDISLSLFLTPFSMLAIGTMLQDLGGKKKWLSFACFFMILLPSHWGEREFSALKRGEVKAEQMTNFEFLKECIPAEAKASVMVYHAADYEIGPQIYAELPQVLPVNLKETGWGVYEWDKVPQDTVVEVSLRSADFILFNAEFQEAYPYMDQLSGSHWVNAFSKFVNSRDIQAFGDQIFLITK